MDFMKQAIEEAYEGIKENHGGPFGSVVVKDGKIVGKGHNTVLLNNDPTCHGEIQAIRDAAKNLQTFDLSGCEIYTTAEPCPMCLGAILWANIKTVCYGCSQKDTDDIGFRDSKFYDYINGKNSLLEMKESSKGECLALFEKYKKLNRQKY